MARRTVQFVQGEYYHIYNRGCNKENIFLSDGNYRFVLGILKKKARLYSVSVIAYCLMPNHYHFLLRQNADKSVGKCIQEVFNKYTKAFNVMYKRTGTLFEGPFKAIHVSKHDYLLHMCRYIHRNPLEAGLVRQLENWKYSNFLEWVELRRGSLFDKQFRKDYFSSTDEYRIFVTEYVSPKKELKEFEKSLLDK